MDDLKQELKQPARKGFHAVQPSLGRLKDRYTMPPFSVWNTREGSWINRRRNWMRLGIKSEEGRQDELTYKIKPDPRYGRATIDMAKRAQTSVFDPVVCELCYQWWCRPDGIVLDPFAGGSVRGMVASLMGLKYWGCELRAEQVTANTQQEADMRAKGLSGPYRPKWVQGDSRVELAKAPAQVDMVFSCPPYGDLEKYSDDPRDISNMDYGGFLDAYGAIIALATSRMVQDSFACWVVATFREKATGYLRDFPGHTVQAFERAGLRYYNEITLVNSVGTGAMRANTSFLRGSHKMVKLHQNVLVFVKGDPVAAAAKVPSVVGDDQEDDGTDAQE